MWYVVKPFDPVRLLAGLVVGALVATTARAEEARTLHWKFVPGESLHYVLEQNAEQATSEEQSAKTTFKQTFDVIWKVNSVDDQGVAEITRTVDRVRLHVQGPGPVVDFDSAAKKKADPRLAEQFRPLLKQPIEMKIDRRGVISDVEVPESTKEALKAHDRPAPGSASAEETFKQMLASDTVEFPAKPLDVGSIWKHTAQADTPLGKQKVTTTYTYAGVAEHEGRQLDKIELKLRLELVEGGREGKNAPQTKPRIVSQESGGVIFFDGTNGRLAQSRMKSKVETEITQGKKTFGEIVESTNRVTLVSGDRDQADREQGDQAGE